MSHLSEYWSELGIIWIGIPTSLKAIVGGVAGTLFGAWIASRGQRKKELIAELRALQSAYALCVSTANKFGAFKKQHVIPLSTDFKAERARFEQHILQPRAQFIARFELHSLPEVHVLVDNLLRLIFDQCSIGVKSTSAAAELTASTKGLNDAVKARNALIEEFKSNRPQNDAEFALIYFGVRDSHRRTEDGRYRGLVEAIKSYCDDCIFFSRQLSDGCGRRSSAILRRNRWKYRLSHFKIDLADWTKAEAAGLLPPDGDYIGWLAGFKERKTRLQKFLERATKRSFS